MRVQFSDIVVANFLNSYSFTSASGFKTISGTLLQDPLSKVFISRRRDKNKAVII